MPTRKTTRKGEDKTTSRAIGTGTGVVGGAAAGAAVGSIVPGVGTAVGTAVGAVVGAVAGGAAGYGIAAAIDPVEEEAYWEAEYPNRPYYDEGVAYDRLRPAYRYGLEASQKYPGETFDVVEARLKRQWPKSRGESDLTWSQARPAVEDAYNRTLTLHEERLRVEKEEEQIGEVDVEKVVVKETQRIDVPVEREEVVVKRKKVGGAAKPGALNARAEEIRIPVKRERVRVTKETVPTEEVTVERRKVREVEKVDETVAREEVRTKEKGRAKARKVKA